MTDDEGREARRRIREEFDTLRSAVRDALPDWIRTADAYALSALPLEIEAALGKREAEATRALREARPILVLVAGMTPQPLVFSAAWFQPRRILLAGSNEILERTGLMSIREQFERALRAAGIEARTVPVHFPPESPIKAYVNLRAAIREAREEEGQHVPVVLDVTGGKKSMTAVGHVLATHLDAVTAVYEDPVGYDAEVARPEPFGTLVRVLEDPGQVLALHDLERVRELWRRGAFGAVVDLLEDVGRRTDDGRDLPGEYSLRGGLEYARACVRWEQSDYGPLVAASERRPNALPDWLAPLARVWTAMDGPFGDCLRPGGLPRVEALKRRPDLLVVHLCDAFRWQVRGAADLRWKLLRLFALGELALEGLAAYLETTGAVRLIGEPALRGWFAASDLASMFALPKQRATRRRDWGGGPSHASLVFVGSPILEARPWVQSDAPTEAGGADPPGFWRRLRNDCAHNLADVEEDRVRPLAEATASLVLAVAERVRSTVPGAAVPPADALGALLALRPETFALEKDSDLLAPEVFFPR